MDFAWNFSTLMKSLKLYKWMFSTQDRDSRVELLLLVDAFHIIALLSWHTRSRHLCTRTRTCAEI